MSWCYLLRTLQLNLQPKLQKADNARERPWVRIPHMGRAQVIDEIRELDTAERELRKRGIGNPWLRPVK